MPAKVTLRDVARQAGVHPGTASRALNDETRSLVRAETVKKVMVAASRLGYRPDYLARSFKTRRSFSVGIVIPDINNPLFPPMVRGIEDRLLSAGYASLLANTENDPEREDLIFDRLLGSRTDGLVIATARRQDPRMAHLERTGVAVVLANRVAEDRGFSAVAVDDGAGAHLVVRHLVGLGHRRIAHIAGPQSLSTGYGRREGFRSSMEEFGLRAGDKLTVFAEAFSIAEGLRCGTELLSRKNRPTAVVAANDMLALGCYTAATQAGLRCPDDVSIVGFNDMPFMDRLSPPLTTVRVPQYELGWHAAELLLERIANPAGRLKVVRLAPELIVRGSTSPAPPRDANGALRKGNGAASLSRKKGPGKLRPFVSA